MIILNDMVVVLVLSVYETLLNNIKIKLLKVNRTNAELSDKLFEIFDLNNAEFKKMARMYSGNRSEYPKETIFDRIDYELKQVEDYKKRKYGDNYATSNG